MLRAAFDLYHQRLFGFLLRMTGSRALAEDLVQETWLRLARSCRKLRDDTNIRAWLFTVARNLHRSHHRWAKVDAERRLEVFAESQESAESPRDHAATKQAAERVETAIGSLPATYREIVLLVGIEEMSPTEAARVLGISAASARKRLSRARSMLREEIDR